jgi:hypothetical protein
MDILKQLVKNFYPFAKKRLKFNKPASLFFKPDFRNAQNPLGKTAFYDPDTFSITVYTANRHPKDILRSFAHELVHHAQNCRGEFDESLMGDMGEGYAQNNEHLREMEREAYEDGNLCFRDWEDSVKSNEIILKVMKEACQNAEKQLIREQGEKQMTVKKNDIDIIKETIQEVLAESKQTLPKKETEEVLSENTVKSGQGWYHLARNLGWGANNWRKLKSFVTSDPNYEGVLIAGKDYSKYSPENVNKSLASFVSKPSPVPSPVPVDIMNRMAAGEQVDPLEVKIAQGLAGTDAPVPDPEPMKLRGLGQQNLAPSSEQELADLIRSPAQQQQIAQPASRPLELDFSDQPMTIYGERKPDPELEAALDIFKTPRQRQVDDMGKAVDIVDIPDFDEKLKDAISDPSPPVEQPQFADPGRLRGIREGLTEDTIKMIIEKAIKRALDEEVDMVKDSVKSQVASGESVAPKEPEVDADMSLEEVEKEVVEEEGQTELFEKDEEETLEEWKNRTMYEGMLKRFKIKK